MALHFPPCLHLQAAWLTAAPAAALPAALPWLPWHCQLPSPRCPGWCGGSGTHTGSARAGAGTPGRAGAPLGTGWSPAAHGEGFSAGKRTAEEQKELLSHNQQRSQPSPGTPESPPPSCPGGLGGTEAIPNGARNCSACPIREQERRAVQQ